MSETDRTAILAQCQRYGDAFNEANSSLMSGTIIALHNCPASQFCRMYQLRRNACWVFRVPCSRALQSRFSEDASEERMLVGNSGDT